MRMLQSAAIGHKHKIQVVSSVNNAQGVLVVWGAGKSETAAGVEQYVRNGGRAICWDVGYWGKCLRLAFDGHHPSFLPEPNEYRGRVNPVALRSEHDPDGHIVLVGIGPKSRHMAHSWEADALRKVREAYPGRRIVYRPKPNREYVELPGVETDGRSKIEDVLRGASLVVTRHSNVGIDACIAGIPVVTDMGVAAFLYRGPLDHPTRPTHSQRRQFLDSVAWLNWRDDEARSAALWSFLQRHLG
jgi:hypothetical protein